MKLSIFAGLVAYVIFSMPVYAGNVLSDIPENPDPSAKYIFYVHGSAEETEGSTDKYEATVKAIAKGSATVISEVRGDTDPNTYAMKLKGQIDSLIGKGVPDKNISVSGYSKGAIISLATAGIVQNPRISYILLAGCSQSLNDKYSIDTNNLAGRILSIYDSADDKYGSCSKIVKKSGDVKFKETKLKTGKGHALFRISKDKFIKKWRDPLLKWAGA